MDTRLNFIRELKEENVIKVVWIAGEDNEADLYTKNLPGLDFNKHASKICGNMGEYHKG